MYKLTKQDEKIITKLIDEARGSDLEVDGSIWREPTTETKKAREKETFEADHNSDSYLDEER